MSYLNPLRELGQTGVKVPANGFGVMGMSEFYGGERDDGKSRALLRDAVELGCTFWDTADMYGYGHNERLCAPLLNEFRDKIFICTKFANVRGPNGEFLGLRGDRDWVREACHRSLERLGVQQIDLYYQHRVDPKVPIEETVRAMKELQDEGKVKFLGLSECSAATLERALKIARIEAVQLEYGPWETTPERNGLLDVMRKHKISMVAYSPLGRGFLTGAIKSLDDLAPNDYRRTDPRFQGDAFALNMRLVDRISKLAAKKSQEIGEEVTPAAFCLAWVLFQGEDFIMIPGTRQLGRLKENLTAGRVLQTFTQEDNEAVRMIVKELDVVGERYDKRGMGLCNQ